MQGSKEPEVSIEIESYLGTQRATEHLLVIGIGTFVMIPGMLDQV